MTNKDIKLHQKDKQLGTEMRESLINVLEELGYKYELDEDGSINFFLNLYDYTDEVRSIVEGVEFYIMFNEECRIITVNEGCWKQIKSNDYDEAGRLLEAINRANAGFHVTSYINLNSSTHMTEVYSSTHYPYIPDKDYLKEQLDNKICEIIFANKIINQFMEEATNEDARQLFTEAMLRHQKVN
jgi:hypothetical protein